MVEFLLHDLRTWKTETPLFLSNNHSVSRHLRNIKHANFVFERNPPPAPPPPPSLKDTTPKFLLRGVFVHCGRTPSERPSYVAKKRHPYLFRRHHNVGRHLRNVKQLKFRFFSACSAARPPLAPQHPTPPYKIPRQHFFCRALADVGVEFLLRDLHAWKHDTEMGWDARLYLCDHAYLFPTGVKQVRSLRSEKEG